MDEFFKTVSLDLKYKPSKKALEGSDAESDHEDSDNQAELDVNGCIDIKRDGVFTTNLDEFVAYLITHRVLDPATTLVKIGLDDGQASYTKI